MTARVAPASSGRTLTPPRGETACTTNTAHGSTATLGSRCWSPAPDPAVDVPLDNNECDQATGADNQFRALWDGTNFKKTAVMDKSNWTWTNISPVLFDLGNLKYSELFFWSQSQGGSVQVKMHACTPH